jgi:hypothetical protein
VVSAIPDKIKNRGAKRTYMKQPREVAKPPKRFAKSREFITSEGWTPPLRRSRRIPVDDAIEMKNDAAIWTTPGKRKSDDVTAAKLSDNAKPGKKYQTYNIYDD